MGDAKKPLKVAIVGVAGSSMMLAPYGDDSWEIWGCSNAWQKIPRWDRWVEIHHLETRRNDPAYAGHYEWMQQQTKPIYTQQAVPDIPASVTYPKDVVIAGVGNLFTSSVDWMLALALHEGATEIGIYGVDMALNDSGVKSEYGHQRPACYYYIGLATGRGVKVTIPPESELLRCPQLYGYETAGPVRAAIEVKLKDIQGRQAEVAKKRDEADAQVAYNKGAIDALEWAAGQV